MELKKQNLIDICTQTLLTGNRYNLMFDKSVQTRVHSFDVFTQTINKDLISIDKVQTLASSIGIQCNKLTFTKDIAIQVDLTQVKPLLDQPVNANQNYMNNKLSEYLKQSYNNYASRCAMNNKHTKFEINKKPSPTQTASAKTPYENFNKRKTSLNENLSSIANKRVRFNESTIEIDELDDDDYKHVNKNF